MPANYSANAIRDAALFKQWDALPDSTFAALKIPRDAIKKLQSELQGYIVLPGDSTYDKDRHIFNPRFEAYPEVIVYCAVHPDAARTLAFARNWNAQFCVRSGGHCTAGFSTGPGVVIDVSAFDSLPAPQNNTIAVGCGVKFGDFNTHLEPYGLHVPGGECPDVCIGGYVQGGGYGFTSTTYGMNCDNAIAMRVLLADGSIIVADKSRNTDLLWAMCGGTGGNFGILLDVEYQLHELHDVFGFALIWPLETAYEQAADVMMLLQEKYIEGAGAGPNLNLQVSLCYQSKIYDNDPEGPLKPYFMVRGLFVGKEDQGLQAIAPLQAMPGCVTQWTDVQPYATMNHMLLNRPQGMPPLKIPPMPSEAKTSRYVAQYLTRDKWIELLSYFNGSPHNLAYMYLEFYGGQIRIASSGRNAFVHRDVYYNAVMDVFWYDEGERQAAEAFLSKWKDMMEPIWNGHVYQNYPSLDTPDYAFAYWGSNLLFLQLVKHKYDPDNAFAFAQQVPQPSIEDPPSSYEAALPEELQAALAAAIDYTGGVKAPSGG